MRQQHSQYVGETHTPLSLKQPQKPKGKTRIWNRYRFNGEWIAELFRSIGANEVIEGGQTMNPSTEDIVKAIKEVNAKKVFILPNNKNIIMAAEQAAEVSDRKCMSYSFKNSSPRNFSAVAFNPESDVET